MQHPNAVLLRPESIDAFYETNGYALPIEVMDEQDAYVLRQDLEAAEAELKDDPEKLLLFRSYPDRLLPSFDKLIRNEKLIEAATSALGPNLMVWSAGLFIKEPHTNKIVSWHQDLTYWGLDDAQEATCWVALSPATQESGCMRFVPGSHKNSLAPHMDTYSDENLLSRGQELAVKVDEKDAVIAALKPGQASMHHGHTFHASGPNRTDDRRIGLAIRYIRPDMKQETGDKTLVSMVSGIDKYGHFKLANTPKGRLHEDDFELCRQDQKIRAKILY